MDYYTILEPHDCFARSYNVALAIIGLKLRFLCFEFPPASFVLWSVPLNTSSREEHMKMLRKLLGVLTEKQQVKPINCTHGL